MREAMRCAYSSLTAEHNQHYYRKFQYWAGVAPGIFRQGADSSDKGAKNGFQGIVNAKNLRQNSLSPSDGGLTCSDRGTIAPSSHPLAPSLVLGEKKFLI